MQVQPNVTAHNLVLAALVDAEQLQTSLSLLADMQAEGLQAEAASCDRLVMLLLMAGELQVACKVTLVCLMPLAINPNDEHWLQSNLCSYG